MGNYCGLVFCYCWEYGNEQKKKYAEQETGIQQVNQHINKKMSRQKNQ